MPPTGGIHPPLPSSHVRIAVRLFVAVFPPAGIQQSLYKTAKDLVPENTIRTVSARNMHLTLKFLGEVPPDGLEEIKESLANLSPRHEPFDARISGFGAFPSNKKARILWSGIQDGAENFRALAGDVQSSLEPLGFERERRTFKPHLTIGRARRRPLAFDPKEKDSTDLGFHVEEIRLVESLLEKSGSVYETLATWPLGARVHA